MEFPAPENAAKTQRAKTLSSYQRIKSQIVDPENIQGDEILDYGAGLGLGSKLLNSDSYEPFSNTSQPTYTEYSQINKKYKLVICSFVLNVVPQAERYKILNQLASVVEENGSIILNVRTAASVMSVKNYKEGPEPNSVITSIGTYQKGFTTQEIKSVAENFFKSYGLKKTQILDRTSGKISIRLFF